MSDTLIPITREERFLDEIAQSVAGGSGGGGTSDYTDLSNKPSINGVTLEGNKTSGQLGIDGVFVAEYNVTSFQDVLSAYNNGDVIIVKNNLKIYQLSTVNRATPQSTPHSFAFMHFETDNDSEYARTGFGIYEITVSSAGWNTHSLIGDVEIGKLLYMETEHRVETKTIGALLMAGSASLLEDANFRYATSWSVEDESGMFFSLINYLIAASLQAGGGVQMDIPSLLMSGWNNFLNLIYCVSSGGVLDFWSASGRLPMRVISTGSGFGDSVTVMLPYGFNNNANTEVKLVINSTNVICFAEAHTVTAVPFPM